MADHGIKSGVAVETWAGDFDCSVCRRKRLPAMEFSKNMQQRRQKNVDDKTLKCKKCVADEAEAERAASATKRAADMTKVRRRRLPVTLRRMFELNAAALLIKACSLLELQNDLASN